MRYYGTIIRWNESRKFGAIKEENTETEVFAPLSAFIGNTETPAEGQRVSFNIVKGRRGRDEAEEVRFADKFEEWADFDANAPYHNQAGKPLHPAWRTVFGLLLAAFVGSVGWYGWQTWQAHQAANAEAAARKPVSMVAEVAEQMKAERKAWQEAVKSPAAADKHKDKDKDKDKNHGQSKP